MQRKNTIPRKAQSLIALLLALGALALLTYPQTAKSVIWTRLADGSSGGGVVSDLAYDNQNDILYAVCAENGLFHKDYDVNNSWTDSNPWTEHLAGRHCYGVDALHTGTGAYEEDYVLVGTDFDGVYRGKYVNGDFTWPTHITVLPTPASGAWSMVRWDDVTFFGNSDQDQIFACGFNDVENEYDVQRTFRYNASGPSWTELHLVDSNDRLPIAHFFRAYNGDIYGYGAEPVVGDGHSGISKTTSYTGNWTDAESEFTSSEDLGAVTGMYQEPNNGPKYILAFSNTNSEWRVFKDGAVIAQIDFGNLTAEYIPDSYFIYPCAQLGWVARPFQGRVYSK